MKKILTSIILGMFLFTLVSASYGYSENGKYYEETGYNQQERLQIQNQFENKYQYQCKANQTCYYDGDDKFSNLEFKIQEQKRFLFFNVEAKQEYILNNNGEIIQVKRNIWSRLLNQEGIKWKK